MAPPGFYQPVPRGLEIRIAEKLAELRARNRGAQGGDGPEDR
jgi:putative ATPase